MWYYIQNTLPAIKEQITTANVVSLLEPEHELDDIINMQHIPHRMTPAMASNWSSINSAVKGNKNSVISWVFFILRGWLQTDIFF